nr:DNA-directed DNA polymerase [Tanacetum cinerariifolium]
MATDGNGDPPVPDLRTMEELCQPTLNGRAGPIAPNSIQATNFGLKNDIIQQVQNSYQFHGFPGDDANKHLDKFLHVTQSIKVNGVTDDALRLYLFPHSLTNHATARFDRFPRNSITTFEQVAKMFLVKYFPPSIVTKLRNEITNFHQRPDDSLFKAWERYKLSIDRCPNHNMLPVTQIDTFYNGLTLRHRDTINATAAGTFMKRRPEECYDLIENMTALTTMIGILLPNGPPLAKPRTYMLREPIKVGNNQGRNQFLQGASHDQNPPPAYQAPAYQAPGYQALVQQAPIPQPQVVTTPEFTNYMKANDAILKNMQTSMTSLTNSNLGLKNMFGQFMKMNTTSSSGSGTLPSNTVTNPKEDLKGITTRSGMHIKDPRFLLPLLLLPNFVDALILMPKFSPTIKSLFTNKDKLFELARTPVNKYCSMVLLKKLSDKLGDPSKFLIPCDFSVMDEYLALADLDASINLMPLSVWNKLSLPKLYPTCMTLELADRSISHSVGVAEDVFIKVETFHSSADLIVVDFDADPRVPLILERSFLKIESALIDVYARELTLRVNNEAVIFNFDQTSRYSDNYNDMTANRIDIIDMACEEYSQEVLGFSDLITSGNPTTYSDPIVSTSSPTLTPFGDSDFILEEVDAFLALEDDPTSSEVDHSYYDMEGDILLFEAFLNDDPSLPPPTQGIVEEKAALIKVLKSHKQAIAWKLSDIKGIDLEFCTHKILMEDDFKPAVQHQRRVNPKIHDVIKNEVEKLLVARLIYPISDSPWGGVYVLTTHQRRGNPKIHNVIKNEVLKLLDAGLIYPISDSPWVSLVHCVPKKGGFTVVKNEENELIPTRLVMRWRVCIDYLKLNEATRKEHFPLHFMDKMLERLARNEYYCFLDGFLGYFQISTDLKDQEKTTFTCPYGTFSYRRLPFGLCNAPERMLTRCKDTNLCLNWEKSHFMVREVIVLGHKISKNRIEVDKAKVDVITKLPHPTTIKGIHNFLGHAKFYRRFKKDFSKIARPMTRLLEKDTLFLFSKECVEAFQTLKRKLTEASILIAPDWDLPFELMCDVS